MRQRVSARFPAYHCRVPTRVALADDNLLVREGLEQVLATETEIDVVASCADLPSLLKAVETGSPDVVVTDIRMPPSQTDEGIQAATLLRRTASRSRCHRAQSVRRSELCAGASRARIGKSRLHAQGAGARSSAARSGDRDSRRGGLGHRSQRRGRPRGGPVARRPPRRSTELTPREVEVLAAIAQGKSNGAISESLVLTKRAVEKHINSIFLKLGLTDAEDVSKRVKAALLFLADEGDGLAASGSPTHPAER